MATGTDCDRGQEKFTTCPLQFRSRFDRILKKYEGKRIAVVSHGGAIKFFLLNWCTVNDNVELVYKKNTILNIKSPCLLKLTFRKNELINLEQID